MESIDATSYDRDIEKEVPLYREVQSMIASLLPHSRKDYIKVLDLGCGTGNTATAIFREYPLASLTALDISKTMLTAAAPRFKHSTWKIEFREGDMREIDFDGEFDAVISAYSTHYFANDERKSLFERILKALKPGGCLITADAVRSDSDGVNSFYIAKWKEFMASSGLSHDDIGERMLRYIKEVKPMEIASQVELMRSAGFIDSDCHFKYMNWGLFCGHNTISKSINNERYNSK